MAAMITTAMASPATSIRWRPSAFLIAIIIFCTTCILGSFSASTGSPLDGRNLPMLREQSQYRFPSAPIVFSYGCRADNALISFVKLKVERKYQPPYDFWFSKDVRVSVGARPGTLLNKLWCADRDREVEWCRTLCLAQGHTRSHRRRPSQQLHRRPPPLELRPLVKLKAGCLAGIAYVGVRSGWSKMAP